MDIAYSSARTVLVVGDGPAARAHAADAALAAGLRVVAQIDIAASSTRLDGNTRLACVMVEIAQEPQTADATFALEHLLVRLDRDAVLGRYASVVSTPASMIDLVAALAPHGRIHQLADASAMERAAAISIAATPEPLSFRDSAADDADSERLRRLTDEVGRIAGALARLSAASTPLANRGLSDRTDGADAGERDEIDSDEIRSMIRARRMRAQYFDAELFADPAWDMLLDLMAAHLDRQRVAISSLCIAAAVPATTALRWIKTLTDNGLFVRRADPADGRRVFIELSEDAAHGMRGYLAAVRRLATAPGMNLAQVVV